MLKMNKGTLNLEVIRKFDEEAQKILYCKKHKCRKMIVFIPEYICKKCEKDAKKA